MYQGLFFEVLVKCCSFAERTLRPGEETCLGLDVSLVALEGVIIDAVSEVLLEGARGRWGLMSFLPAPSPAWVSSGQQAVGNVEDQGQGHPHISRSMCVIVA